jgi:hypothetical protein
VIAICIRDSSGEIVCWGLVQFDFRKVERDLRAKLVELGRLLLRQVTQAVEKVPQRRSDYA